jgi:hypothetical protein
MAELEKMSITPCTVEDNGDIKAKSDSEGMKVMINPSSFTHDHIVSYSKGKVQGANGKELKFQNIDAEKVSFDLVFDGTGVVQNSEGTVKDKMDKLKKIVYQYDGKEHQPDPVRLSWGGFLFFGRLTSLNIEYTLFKPSGEPLRAKTKLSFSGYMSKEEQALRKNNSSPDLTHIIIVKAGDTLPLLCHQVYKDCAYYPDVARINGLNSLQYLRPGLKLKFPPLR